MFCITFGVNPGFNHNNEEKNGLALVAKTWAEIAESYYKTTGIYVSASLSEQKTVYRTEWGCPNGGEDTILATGVMNSHFCSNELEWEDIVRAIGRTVKDKLGQQSITIIFSPCRIDYMNDKFST